MGLAEKRLIDEYKKTFLTNMAPKLKSVGGLNLEVEVDWDQIYGQLNETDLESLEQYMSEIFCTPVLESLESICSDDLGKGLISPMLKKIRFCCSGDIDNNLKAYTLKNGTLLVDHSMRNYHSHVTPERTTYLTTLIEDML